MPTTYQSLLVDGATGWHDGSQAITYNFFGYTVPSYIDSIDTNYDGQADYYFSTPSSGYAFAANSSINMTGTEQALALNAIQAWNEVANINMGQGAANTSDIMFGSHAFNSQVFGFASEFPSGGVFGLGQAVIGSPSYHGDIWINSNNSYQDISEWGHTSGHTYLHELGHALGLTHPDQDPNNWAYNPTNNNQYTVMSYLEHPGETGEYINDQAWPITPMLYDIQAIQHLYGVNTSTRNVGTSYFSNSSGFDQSAYQYAADEMEIGGRSIIMTIWDAGGVDVIDTSALNMSVTINLLPGGFSTIGEEENNVAIAAATVVNGQVINIIENAIGGAFGDDIRGNNGVNVLNGRGGNDFIMGRGGNDVLIGGNGADILVGGDGADILNGGMGDDILSGGADNDRMVGADGNDRFSGGLGVNSMIGGAGNDFMYDGGGNSVLAGGAGNDRLIANSGNDRLIGGTGNDTMNGGNGNDTLTGDQGNDYLVGGYGVDTFVFRADMDSDRVVDFVADTDRLFIEDGLAGGATAAEIEAMANVVGSDVVIDFGDGDIITLLGITTTAGLADDILIV